MEKSFYVAGVQHHQWRSVIDEMEEGQQLMLVPEPSNKFDPNAVRIVYNKVMIGYVPKKFSAEIASMIDIGEDYVCTIEKLNKQSKPWEMIKVVVEDVEEEISEDYLEDDLNTLYEDGDEDNPVMEKQ